MPDDSLALTRQSKRLAFWARIVLVPVAAIGAVLSFRSLYEAATPTFGPVLAAGFPLLVDLLILGASLQYVAGAKIGRPMAGWRLTAHAGVAGTLALNALAAPQAGDIPWHVTAPAVWAILVELTAKQVLGEWRATHAIRVDKIFLSLWITAPIESIRTRLLMFRTGTTNAHQARISVGVHAAAREALHLALPGRFAQPGRSARRVRRVINRQLRAGSLPPAAILRPLGWTADGVVLRDTRPAAILHGILHGVLSPSQLEPSPTEPETILIQRTIDLTTSPATDYTAPSVKGVEHTPQILQPAEYASIEQPRDLVQELTTPVAQPGPEHREEHPQPGVPEPSQHIPPAPAEFTAAAPLNETSKADLQQQRLVCVSKIIQEDAGITGPALQGKLAENGWPVSARTATRILADARRQQAEEQRLRVVRT